VDNWRFLALFHGRSSLWVIEGCEKYSFPSEFLRI
jgi:hypothetical protein